MSQLLSKFPLWEHQERAFWFAYARQGVMFDMGMGTGKSAVTVALTVSRNHRRVLIACPLKVVPVWPREFAKHSPVPFNVLPLSDRWDTKRKLDEAQRFLRLAEVRREPAAIVINHESAWRDPIGEWILKAGFDFGVIDESHRGKAYNGKFGRYLLDLGRHIPFRACLSGTPMSHSPLDIFAQYRYLDSSIFGYKYHPFKTKYAIQGGFQNRESITDPTDRRLREWERERLIAAHKELHEKYFQIAIRITKDEALDLPEELHIDYPCQLDPNARQLYRDLETDFYAAVERGEITAQNALVKLLRLQQITSGEVKMDDGTMWRASSHKERLLADMLEDIQEPVVIFTRFTQDLDTIARVAKNLNRRYGEISGRRNDLTDIGTAPSDADIFGVNIQSGGTGVDLTHFAVAIYYSCGYSLADYLQSLSRIHRPGQTRKCTFYYLVTEGTVDERVYESLQKKQNVIESILNYKKGAQHGHPIAA